MPFRAPFFLLLSLLLFACASPREALRNSPVPIPELPSVPRVDGTLRLQLVYPRTGATRPGADSTFLFGNTGTGGAALSINGEPVAVAENGAFLAFVPVRASYRLVAARGGQRDTLLYQYRVPERPAPSIESFAARTAVVTGGKKTLDTGSEIVGAEPRPDADRRWFLPIGTRLRVDGKLAGRDLYRIRLTDATEAWIGADAFTFEDSLAATPPASEGRIEEGEGFTDVVLAAGHAPFLIEPERDRVRITVYGRAGLPPAAPTAWLRTVEASAAPDSTVLDLRSDGPVWGFKAFYADDGDLVVRLRHAPRLEPNDPLRGARILVDAGHPPGGAVGPTGLTEAEANLQIARRLFDKLRARGAEPLMTRTGPDGFVSNTDSATDLWARVDSAVAWNADVLVSVHNNAFGDGTNPFRHYGSETYYFHPFSRPLAEALIAEIAPTTGLPNLGAKRRSLALVRPTWMPSTLTESLFMMFPQQEVALRDPAFLDRLAEAHLRGIEAFLRGALQP